MLLRLKRSSEDFYIPAKVHKIVNISVSDPGPHLESGSDLGSHEKSKNLHFLH
jgi:hypothetical protein